MYSRWFSTPEPDYATLALKLYGSEVGSALQETYLGQLSRRDLWGHRLDWSGVAVYDSEGTIVAHAVVQVTLDRPLVYVGYVECIEDSAAAAFLMQTLREKLGREHPDRAVYMPVNLSIWHNYRFQMRGEGLLPFESPTKLYYAELLSDFLPGEEHYSSYRLKIMPNMEVDQSRADQSKAGVTNSRYTVREWSLDNALRDLRAIYDLSTRVFEDVHSVPSFEEFQVIYSHATDRADPRYILFAEESAQPVGFVSSIMEGDALFVKTLAVLPEHQQRGVGRLLYGTLCARALNDGCDTLYGLMMRNDRLITQLLPPGAEKVAEYVLRKSRD